MKVIGLCGGSGSGKGEVAGIFKEYGIPSIDTDRIYHELTSCPTQCLIDLVAEFGDQILTSDGILDRGKLREIVFSDTQSNRRESLNRITHFHILSKTRELISEYRKKEFSAVLVEAPLLFESEFDKECDFVIAVTADMETRIKRIIMRDNITPALAEKRIKAQLDDEYIVKKSRYNIINNGTISELRIQVKKIIQSFAEKEIF